MGWPAKHNAMGKNSGGAVHRRAVSRLAKFGSAESNRRSHAVSRPCAARSITPVCRDCTRTPTRHRPASSSCAWLRGHATTPPPTPLCPRSTTFLALSALLRLHRPRDARDRQSLRPPHRARWFSRPTARARRCGRSFLSSSSRGCYAPPAARDRRSGRRRRSLANAEASLALESALDARSSRGRSRETPRAAQ